ncbi:hypothetical protein ACH5RR_006300 [Cinchona calisaya]|uniref:Uncharacterized protein n=1 Tax=Cinchona calisaya TaxID=153742 RepID=A0ABD3ANM9_9GENT
MEPKLPLGYTFEPSPQDLIFDLEHKAVGNPFPTNGYVIFTISIRMSYSKGGKIIRFDICLLNPRKRLKVDQDLLGGLGIKEHGKVIVNVASGNIIDQDGSMDQFLLSNIDFGIGNGVNNQDHPNPLMFNTAEDDGYLTVVAAAGIDDDSMQVLDNQQPLVDELYSTSEEIL